MSKDAPEFIRVRRGWGFHPKNMEKEEKIKKAKDIIRDFIRVLTIIQWLASIIGGSGITIVVVILIPEISLLWSIILGILLILAIAIFMVLANILILKKREIVQTMDIEAQRRKDEREPMIRSLKRELKDFISFWENSRPKILENSQNLNIKQLNDIRALGDKAEKKNLDSGMFLSENIENEANEIIKDIKDFSMRIRVNVKTVGNDEVDTKRNQIIVKDGDILTTRVKEFIKKI